MLTRKMIIGMIMVVFVSMSTTAWGTTYYVDQNGDDSNGLSWAAAFNDLQDALDAVSSGDEIWVAKGTYKPTTSASRHKSFELIDGVAIYGGFDPTIGDDTWAERDYINNVTILSGDIDDDGVLDDDNSYHVVYSEDCNTDTVLDGFTITHGYANGSPPNYRGGGMYNAESSPTVNNCIFTGNNALGGGGMHNDTYADTVVTNCTFVANSAVGLGGAMVNNNASATVKNCLFFQNSVSGSTSYGGAIANFGDAPELINCTFVGNVARGGDYGYGGALFSSSETTVTVVNCIFWGNWATTNGTEIYSAGVTTISYCDIEGGLEYPNVCGNITDGGGNISTDPCFINIFDFSDITDGYGPPNTINVKDTIQYTVEDEIEYDNDGTPRKVTAKYTSYIKFEYDPLSSNSVMGKVIFNWGNGATDVDEDFHLDWDSPCINAGDPNGNYTGQTDIDGQPRIMAGRVDMGADEFSGIFNMDKEQWYDSIQEAIYDANVDDTIEVGPGVYYESIDFDGKAITVSSTDPNNDDVVWATIIDANCDAGNPGHVVTFENSEDSNSFLIGFTITGGYAAGSPFDCYGGGIYCYNTSPTITNCVIAGNSSNPAGAGIFCGNASPTISNCLITGNTSTSGGGGMYNYFSADAMLTNCTFSGNSAVYGGGMFNYIEASSTAPTVINCIFWADTAEYGPEIYSWTGSPKPSFGYCDIEGSGGSSGWDPNLGTDLGGNIDDDPLFVDDANDDYHLDENSPCIDVGDPNDDYEGEKDIDGDNRVIDIAGKGDGNVDVDMGADEYKEP